LQGIKREEEMMLKGEFCKNWRTRRKKLPDKRIIYTFASLSMKEVIRLKSDLKKNEKERRRRKYEWKQKQAEEISQFEEIGKDVAQDIRSN
jgi:hypothetical protein